MTDTQSHSRCGTNRPLSELLEGFWITQLLGAAVTLGIPDQIADGAKSYEQIAISCEAHAPSILRVMRALQTVGVCRARSETEFELTDRGHVLRRGVSGSICGRVSFTSEIMWDLYGQLTKVIKTGRSLPAGRKGFEKLAESPGLVGMHMAMIESSIRIIADATRVHDFGAYSRVLDVGGGYGGALASLLKRFSDMHGSVLDLPYLRNNANAYLSEQGVADRANFIDGDFFESVPEGYDCYLLKYIVHDWSDSDAIQILRNCVAAARKDSHFILLERVVPETLTESPDHQAIMQIDLAMMTTGGKERDHDEYRSLLLSAGLRMTVIDDTTHPCSVIHAVPIV